jgi:hypothetical protein
LLISLSLIEIFLHERMPKQHAVQTAFASRESLFLDDRPFGASFHRNVRVSDRGHQYPHLSLAFSGTRKAQKAAQYQHSGTMKLSQFIILRTQHPPRPVANAFETLSRGSDAFIDAFGANLCYRSALTAHLFPWSLEVLRVEET